LLYLPVYIFIYDMYTGVYLLAWIAVYKHILSTYEYFVLMAHELYPWSRYTGRGIIYTGILY